ncbi:hypothetical protein LCGC14_2641480, partial [marine sediment metagenome]
NIDPWYIRMFKKSSKLIEEIKNSPLDSNILKRAKMAGFSDEYIGHLKNVDEFDVRKERKKADIRPTYKMVDTCAAEFEASTPYFYSSYDDEDETIVSDKPKVLIIGSGPNRIGQGIEFDYCCVQASFELRSLGYETIMVNSNPETVSTDYDTSDRLYFEPVTFEDVMNIIEKEKPAGVIVQFGGQTPLNIAALLEEKGVNILGTSAQSIKKAESREEFSNLIKSLDLRQPDNGTARELKDALKIADGIGYPVLVRPSFILGGKKMAIFYDEKKLEKLSYYQILLEMY